MSDDEDETEAETEWTSSPAQTAGPAAFGWRWIFPVVSLAAAIAVPFLALAGGDAVLRSTGGVEVEEPSDDPAAPGYVAFVVASPTSIVFDIDDSGDLVGAAFIGLSGEQGGRVLVVPAELAVEPEVGELETLALAYERGGADRAANGFQRMLGLSVDEVIELDPAARAIEMEDDLPIDYSLPTSLVDAEGELIFERGRIQLDQEGALAVVSVLGPDEEGFLRADRQQRLWESWIEQVARSGVGGVGDEPGVAGSVATLAAGNHRVDLIPVVPAKIGEGKPFYLVEDDDFAGAMVAEVVVFPELFEDDRPSVRVENGTTDQSLHSVAADAVERGGGRLVVISNAPILDVTETVIEVRNADFEALAHEIADELGGARVELVEVEDVDVDLFVVIGSDLVGAPS
ncbi:MAG: LCP family protein [Acidimicrobiales bacterium]